MEMVKSGNSFWIVLLWIVLFGIAVEKTEGSRRLLMGTSIENILMTRHQLVYEDGNGDGFVWNNDQDHDQLADADAYGSTSNSAAGFVNQGLFTDVDAYGSTSNSAAGFVDQTLFTDADIYNYYLSLQGDQGTMIKTGDYDGYEGQDNSMNSQGENGNMTDGYQASRNNTMYSAADNYFDQQLQPWQGSMTADGGESSNPYDQGENNSLNSASATTDGNMREYTWVTEKIPISKDIDYTIVPNGDGWFQEFPMGQKAKFEAAPMIPRPTKREQKKIKNTLETEDTLEKQP